MSFAQGVFGYASASVRMRRAYISVPTEHPDGWNVCNIFPYGLQIENLKYIIKYKSTKWLALWC
jgi:hypothetical protein